MCWTEAGELTRRGQPFALATVVWRQGPSSGQQGSRAIITADGDLHGWIGGACAEPVVIREAREVITEGTPRLLLLGTPEQFARSGAAIPDGMTRGADRLPERGRAGGLHRAGASAPHLVDRGPLADGADAGRPGPGAGLARHGDRPGAFAAADADEHSMVLVATQGHGDEEALSRRSPPGPPTWAWSDRAGGARRCWATSRTGACRSDQLDRVRVPAGLDLGRTSHRRSRSRSWPSWSSCARPALVAGPDQAIQPRAAGRAPATVGRQLCDRRARGGGQRAEPRAGTDPVCGMTVTADRVQPARWSTRA